MIVPLSGLCYTVHIRHLADDIRADTVVVVVVEFPQAPADDTQKH